MSFLGTYLKICAHVQIFRGKATDFTWLSKSFIMPSVLELPQIFAVWLTRDEGKGKMKRCGI